MGVKVKSLICTPPKLGGHAEVGVGVGVKTTAVSVRAGVCVAVAVGRVPVTVAVGVPPPAPFTAAKASTLPHPNELFGIMLLGVPPHVWAGLTITLWLAVFCNRSFVAVICLDSS